MATHSSFRENALRVVAVVGLIAVLLLGAWGIIQLAFFIPSLFNNLPNVSIFDRQPAVQESLTVTLPAATQSGDSFTLAWRHTGAEGAHSYAVSYACVEGLSVKAPLPTGGTQTVACNTPFNYTAATSSVQLSATADKQSTATFTVVATKLSTGAVAKTASGATTVRPKVAGGTSTQTPSSSKPAASTKPSTSSYYPSGRTTNLYGQPDLAVYITSVPQSVRVGSRIALQFVVENIGTNVTPSNWSFSANLPYNPVYTYQSGGQQALYPGDKIVYTLGYDAATPAGCATQYDPYGYPLYGNTNCWSYPYSGYSPYGYSGPQTVSIQVDPLGYVYEVSKANNFAEARYHVY